MRKTVAKPVKQIFMSYAHADKDVARKLSSLLQKAGYNVWTDEEVLPGSDWLSDIKRALDTSDAMVVLLSPETPQSRYVQHEIEYALTNERFNGRLIPVMLAATKKFPWILESLQMVQFQNPRQAANEVAEALGHTS